MTAITLSPTSATTSTTNLQERNQLRQLAQLIGEIFTLFSQLSQKNQKEMGDIKLRYNVAILKQSDSLHSQGNWGATTATVALVFAVVAIAVPNKVDRELFNLVFVQQGPSAVGGFFSHCRQAEGKIQEGKSSLESLDLQDKISKQSESNAKDQIAQTLQAQMQLVRAASAPTN